MALNLCDMFLGHEAHFFLRNYVNNHEQVVVQVCFLLRKGCLAVKDITTIVMTIFLKSVCFDVQTSSKDLPLERGLWQDFVTFHYFL